MPLPIRPKAAVRQQAGQSLATFAIVMTMLSIVVVAIALTFGPLLVESLVDFAALP